MEWTFFIFGFVTGISSFGFLILLLAIYFAIRGQRLQQEIAENAGKTFQDIMAKAGTAAMMKRDGGSQH